MNSEKDLKQSKKMTTLSNKGKSHSEWQLVWEDTFQSTNIDKTKWNAVDGGWGFGNEEWQYYTGRSRNVRIEDGQLVIEAHREDYEENRYTSAKLTTEGKAEWKYGRFSIRAKLPEGQGMWPAIWMMPTNMELYSSWPACGEIDIMEQIGHLPETVHGTLHYGVPHTYTGDSYTLPDNQKFSEDFHLFTLEWEPGEFRWYVDDVLYAKQNEWFSNHSIDRVNHLYPAPFDREFFLQINLAVGGKWPGYPNESTVFPQRLIIDYVKVYQKYNTKQ